MPSREVSMSEERRGRERDRPRTEEAQAVQWRKRRAVVSLKLKSFT